MTFRMPTSGPGATEEHARLLWDSYRKWTGHDLLDLTEETSLREALFFAPKVILSHGTEEDPILNYGNRAALKLWETDWETFTNTPSRYTAEAMEREERQRFLERVNRFGYIGDYAGIRISRTGRRFWIEGAVVWNLVDAEGTYRGQAAAFSKVRHME